MLKTSAILAYSSLTLVNPWIRPVGLPWASWVWKMSLGLGYSGGEGGGSGGAVGSTHCWFCLWFSAFCSSMTSAPAAFESFGLIASSLCIRPQFRNILVLWELLWWCPVLVKRETVLSLTLANQPTTQSCGENGWISDESNLVTVDARGQPDPAR